MIGSILGILGVTIYLLFWGAIIFTIISFVVVYFLGFICWIEECYKREKEKEN